jgi:hypothetical protein
MMPILASWNEMPLKKEGALSLIDLRFPGTVSSYMKVEGQMHAIYA